MIGMALHALKKQKIDKIDNYRKAASEPDKPNVDWKQTTIASVEAIGNLTSAFCKLAEKAGKLEKELSAAVEYHERCSQKIAKALQFDYANYKVLECSETNGTISEMSLFDEFVYNIESIIKADKNVKQWIYKFLEEIHATLQGDLSYSKVAAVKKKIENIINERI